MTSSVFQKQERKESVQRAKRTGSHEDSDSLRETQGKAKGPMASWKEQKSKWLRRCPGAAYDQPSRGTGPRTAAFSLPSPGVCHPS